jgi:hypothetical protein
MAHPHVLTLPGQVAAQAEFIVDNLLQTYYQHAEHIDAGRGIYDCVARVPELDTGGLRSRWR